MPNQLGDETWFGCDDVIRAFASAWREGQTPAIDNFWLTQADRRVDLLRELVNVDLEFRLKLGESVRIEPYLARYPELAQDSQVVLELIAAEYELRRRREVDLGLEEYARRFPALREQFAERLRLLAQLAELGPGTVPKVPGYEILAELGRGGMEWCVRTATSRWSTSAWPDASRRCSLIARRQQARSLGLRAATSLVRLQARRNELGDGVQLLSEAVASFPESGSNADLDEARKLLGQE
jgi:hypothetical protein